MHKYEEKLARVLPLVEKFETLGVSVTLDLKENGSEHTQISVWPTESQKEVAVRAGLEVCGKLVKDDSGNMSATLEDGTRIVLFSVLSCRIIGYEIELEPVMKETGEIKEVKRPIYECRSPLSAITVVE